MISREQMATVAAMREQADAAEEMGKRAQAIAVLGLQTEFEGKAELQKTCAKYLTQAFEHKKPSPVDGVIAG